MFSLKNFTNYTTFTHNKFKRKIKNLNLYLNRIKESNITIKDNSTKVRNKQKNNKQIPKDYNIQNVYTFKIIIGLYPK